MHFARYVEQRHFRVEKQTADSFVYKRTRRFALIGGTAAFLKRFDVHAATILV